MSCPRAQALVVANRDIMPGDELYVEYGSSYWKKRGVVPGIAPVTQPNDDDDDDDANPLRRGTWPAACAITGFVLLIIAVRFAKRLRSGVMRNEE